MVLSAREKLDLKNVIRALHLFSCWSLVELAKKMYTKWSHKLIHFDLLSEHSWAVLLQKINCYNYLEIKVFFLVFKDRRCCLPEFTGL